MYDWVSTDYYYDKYVGDTVPGEDLENYLRDACEYLDLVCSGQINAFITKFGYEALSTSEKWKIETSACELADFLYLHKEDLYPTTSSYSVGDLTVNNRFSQAYTEVNQLRVPPQIYLRLKGTRFFNRTCGSALMIRK